MRFNYFLYASIKSKNDECILTFDDGPDPELTPIILDILEREKIKAVFFVIGQKAEKHPEIVTRIEEEGHLIGNHSYSHNNFMSLYSKSRLRIEIKKAQETIETITHKKTTLFRPPIGYTNPNYAKVLKEAKLHCVGWSLRSYDSIIKDPIKLANRLVKKVKPGSIILLHDNLSVTAGTLEQFIQRAKENGIKFASTENINELIHD